MPLDKQTVSLALIKGIDTKSDSKQQIPGSLTLLENGRFTEPQKIRKRPGHDALGQSILGGSSSISVGSGVASFRDELLESNGTEIYSYSQGNNAWADKGAFFNLDLSTSSVVRNSYQQTSQDSCYHPQGIQCFVWEDSSGGSRYSIIDYETKLQLVTNAVIASDATKPKCYALGSYIVITHYDTSETDINIAYLPAATPTSALIYKDVVTDPANDEYDAAIVGDRLFFVYNRSGGNLTLGYLNALLQVSTLTTISATVAAAVGIFGDSSNRVWVSYWNSTAVRAAIYDYAKNQIIAPTTIETIANVKNVTLAVVGSTAKIIYDITAAATYNYNIKSTSFTLAGAVGTPAFFILSLSLASKAFVYNSVVYVMGNYASSYQPTYFLLDSSAKVAAKISPLTAGGVASKSVIPQINEIDTGVYQISYLQKNTTTAVDGLIVSQTGVQQATVDFTRTTLISTDLASNLHIGGGMLAMYDGTSVVEHGFHVFPEAAVLGQTTSGSIANGTYQYSVCYEWMDNAGSIHRSAPSIPSTITTTGSNGTVTVTVPNLRITSKSNVSIVVYRTAASGTIFYRVSSLTSPTVSSSVVESSTFNDTSADASIIGNNQIYTTGEVENISVPSTEIFTNFKNRVIAVPAENKSQWWASKQVVPGSPVEFSDFFVYNMDQYGGEITAVGVLDDKIVFFKENTKFYVYGNGPAASGANDDFSNPERVTGDTGSTNQRSIVSTPVGLMYQSPKGVYLLDRAIQDKYIGSPVEAYTKDALVTSAVLMAAVNQVRMTLDSGVTLVYDYFVNEWNIDTGLQAQDSTLWQGSSYAIVQSSGRILVENPNVFTDAGQFVKLKIKTGWISFAKVQGFQRIWKALLLGTYYSPHRLIVRIAENFNPSPFQTTYIDNLNLGTPNYGDDDTWGSGSYWGGAFPSYNFDVQLERQKCTSIQITIEDTQSTDYGEGYDLSNIAFEVGVKKGLNKLKAAASYG